jgi:flagellar biosynthesis protein FlhG
MTTRESAGGSSGRRAAAGPAGAPGEAIAPRGPAEPRDTAQPRDQASRLRELAQGAAAEAVPMLPAIAVTGGKGGVGKTCVAVNLALTLAELGVRPLLVDLDLGLANADVMLGVPAGVTLHEVISGGRPAASAVQRLPSGISFLPAASGREELTRLQARSLHRLLREVGKVAAGHDLIVFDTAAGIGREVSLPLQASRVVLMVVTPEPTSLTDAYALIKVLEQASPGKDIRVLVNQAANQEEGVATFGRLRKVAQAYLRRDLVLAGCVPRDRAVGEAVRNRKPFAGNGDSSAAKALRALALGLKSERWR